MLDNVAIIFIINCEIYASLWGGTAQKVDHRQLQADLMHSKDAEAASTEYKS